MFSLLSHLELREREEVDEGSAAHFGRGEAYHGIRALQELREVALQKKNTSGVQVKETWKTKTAPWVVRAQHKYRDIF